MWEIIGIVFITLTHDEPNYSMSMGKLSFQPREVGIGLRQRSVDIIKCLIFKTKLFKSSFDVCVKNLVAKGLISMTTTRSSILTNKIL
jgi:hypothetical protein